MLSFSSNQLNLIVEVVRALIFLYKIFNITFSKKYVFPCFGPCEEVDQDWYS